MSVTIKWQAPPSSFVKINFDVSVVADLAASDFVTWDVHGSPISIAYSHVGSLNACRRGISIKRYSLMKAKGKGFTRVEVAWNEILS